MSVPVSIVEHLRPGDLITIVEVSLDEFGLILDGVTIVSHSHILGDIRGHFVRGELACVLEEPVHNSNYWVCKVITERGIVGWCGGALIVRA